MTALLPHQTRRLPSFRLEAYFAQWEFAARHQMTASDAQTMTLTELLKLGTDAQRDAFADHPMSYCEPAGAADLRAAIATTYDTRSDADILCFAGAEEGLYATMHALLAPGDHAIVVTPNYQAAESVPLSICAATGVKLDPDDDWSLDIDRVAAAVQPNTILVSINFPHNPTGAILPRARLDALIALCRHHGLWLFSDEVYRPLGPIGTQHLPQVADLYERGISLNVMSKAYGLPGLRIGWIATADRALLARAEQIKHYLSICNAGLSERLALIALGAGPRIIARNCRLVTDNLVVLDAFFAQYPDLFDWARPDGGCVGYPRYRGSDGVEVFAERLVREHGVLVLPASLYESALTDTPHDRFRIGFGRQGIQAGLDAMHMHLRGLA